MSVTESAEKNRTRKGKSSCLRKEWDEFDERCAAEGDSSVLIGWVSAPSWHHEGDIENSKGWTWVNYRLGFC